jgi:hypothetical protein
VKAGKCLIVGMAALWLWFVPDWYLTGGEGPRLDNQVYDYQVVEDRVIFNEAPKAKMFLSTTWHELIEEDGTARTSPLYLLGENDGKNKIFYISEKPEVRTHPDLGEGWGRWVAVWSSYEKDWPGALLKKRERLTQSRKNLYLYGTWIFAIMGVIVLLDSHCYAFDIPKNRIA